MNQSESHKVSEKYFPKYFEAWLLASKSLRCQFLLCGLSKFPINSQLVKGLGSHQASLGCSSVCRSTILLKNGSLRLCKGILLVGSKEI